MLVFSLYELEDAELASPPVWFFGGEVEVLSLVGSLCKQLASRVASDVAVKDFSGESPKRLDDTGEFVWFDMLKDVCGDDEVELSVG